MIYTDFTLKLTISRTGAVMVRVTAAILVKGGKLLIGQRKPTVKLANKWELPGGKIEKNETPEDCLVRELKEEFDIEVTVGEYLGSNIHHYDFGTIELMSYRAFLKSGDLKLIDHSRIEWITPDQLSSFDFAPADIPIIEKIRTGEILLED